MDFSVNHFVQKKHRIFNLYKGSKLFVIEILKF
jgi:hypothetical protein